MPVLSTFSIILSGIWQLDLPFCAMTAMKMMETHIINGINVINMVKLDSEIQARLAQIWQLSASVFLWFASQKMGFQSVRSRRSTGSFWHGTWQCFGLPWPCTSSQCAYPQTSPNIPKLLFSLKTPPHRLNRARLDFLRAGFSINALVMHDITALLSWPERWTMPPLFCLLTLAVMAFKNCKTL